MNRMLPMAGRTILVALLALILFFPGNARAHRVNIFAWQDGDQIRVECGFNRSSRVRNGKITVYSGNGEQILLEGHTDENGNFSFPVPEMTQNGVRIRIDAGEGHQNEWLMPADEFGHRADSPDAAAVDRPATASVPSAVSNNVAIPALSPEQIRSIVRQELSEQLAPIRRDLASQVNADPGLRDIVGGIGWILGLVGIALYFRSRRR